MYLDHFQKLARDLSAAREGHMARCADLRERIQTETVALHQTDDDKRRALHRETVRKLKREQAELQAPPNYDPLSDIAKYNAKSAPAELPAVTIPKGQTGLSVFNNLVMKTDAVIADLQRVEKAPQPAEEIAAGLHDQIEALSKLGTPSINANGTLEFRKQIGSVNAIDAAALVAWACKTQMLSAADALAARVAEGAPMTAGERATAMADGQIKLLAALRLENEAAIAAERDGQRVVRRRHVHPCVMLGAVVSPAAAYDWLRNRKGI